MTSQVAESASLVSSLDPDKVVHIDVASDHFRDNFINILSNWATRPPVYAVNGESVQLFCSRYADVMAVFQDSARFSTEIPRRPGMESLDKFMGVDPLTVIDGERHDRLRRLMNPPFAPAGIAALKDKITTLAKNLVEDIARHGNSFDAQAQLGQRLMPTVLLDIMFALSPQQKDAFLRMSEVIPLATRIPPGGTFPAAYRDAFDHCRDVILGLIDERRTTPGEDFISKLIMMREAEDRLTDKELFDQIFTITVASLQSTASSLVAVLWVLGRNPDQFQLVKDDPELIPQAIEECLRYHGAGYMNFARFARADTEIGGTFVPAGMVIRASSQAACLDAELYPDPLRVDVMRTPKKNTPLFGAGIHMCLGNRLARMVLRVALEELIRRFPKLRLADPDFFPTYRGQAGETQIAELPMLLN